MSVEGKWTWDLYGSLCDNFHEYKTGYLTYDDAYDACMERMTEITDENDLDEDTETDFEWEITEE